MEFEPRTWNAPKSPGLVGNFAPNDLLSAAALWQTGGVGPEDVVIDHEGRAITGLEDGRIIRFPPLGGRPDVIAETGGRPLGIELAHDGSGLIVCDAERGLLAVEWGGAIRVLASSYGETPFMLTNNASVAADGTIYFSVSSHRWPLAEYRKDVMERSATGRLYRRDPDGTLDVVLDGMVFANGVALAPDASFVLCAELGSYRIHRLWLSGPKEGTQEVFVDNLPGFPDNISQTDGIFWVAFPRPRDRMLDATLPRPILRTGINLLPEKLQPSPARYGWVAAFDANGHVLANMQDPSGRVAASTGVRVHDDLVYIGSLSEPTLAVAPLPPLPGTP